MDYSQHRKPQTMFCLARHAYLHLLYQLAWLEIFSRTSCYLPKLFNKRIYNITDADANILIRDLAAETYDISKPEELQFWTCHSIRAGACCILCHGHPRGKYQTTPTLAKRLLAGLYSRPCCSFNATKYCNS
jgi:hypothetical protein